MLWTLAVSLLLALVALAALAALVALVARRLPARTTRHTPPPASPYRAPRAPPSERARGPTDSGVDDAPEPRPSREALVKLALNQELTRAFNDWVRTVSVCPACGTRAPGTRGPYPPGSLAARLAASRPAGTPVVVPPTLDPFAGMHSPAPPVRTAGTLRFAKHDEHHVQVSRGPHFFAYTLTITCTACDLRLEFIHTDSPPHPNYTLRHLPAPAGPRRRWRIASAQGEPLGSVFAGGDEGVTTKPEPGATSRARAALAIAAVFIERALVTNLEPLGEAEADEARRAAVAARLPSWGASLVAAEGAAGG